MPRLLRFQPPQIERSAELDWVLRAAFGPKPAEPTRSVEVARVLELARDLDLGARIASRFEAAELTNALGADAARQLAYDKLAAAASHRLVESALRRVVEHAARIGTELIVLKHAALWASGIPVEGRRGVRDLDVLVRADRARALQRALIDDGFTESGLSAQTHHLPAVRTARGEAVEVHTAVLGLSVRGVRPVTADALLSAELVERRELPFGHCFTLAHELLIAHVIVHGYAQHGSSPLDYPITRMLGDVIDLIGDASADEIAQRCHGWVSADMAQGEVRAVCRLAAALRAGTLVDSESLEGCLLRHVVAASCDDEYQRSLGLRRLDWLREAREWAPAARRVLVPSRADLELEHGPIDSRLRLLVLGRVHALRKLGALAGSLIAQMRVRLRRAPR